MGGFARDIIWRDLFLCRKVYRGRMKVKFVFKKYVLRYNMEKIYSSTDIFNLKVRCLRFLYEVDNRTLHFMLCWTECFEESVYQRKEHKFRLKKSVAVQFRIKKRIQFMFFKRFVYLLLWVNRMDDTRSFVSIEC